MGDRSHTRHGPKRGGGCCAPFVERWDPVKYSVALADPAEVYFRTKWCLQPCSRLAAIDIGQKLWVPVPFLGRGLGPHLTRSALAEAFLHTKWHPDASSHLATIEMGRKLGMGLHPPLGGGGLGPHLTQSLGLRPTFVPSGILIHPAIWPQ